MLNIGARLNALGAMTACGLARALAKKHAVEQLTACCEAVKASGVDTSRIQNCEAVQEKLVQTPAFTERLRGLLRCGLSSHDIDAWLEMEPETGCRLEYYSDREIAAVMGLRFHSMRLRQLYAMWFMKQYADEVVPLHLQVQGGHPVSGQPGWFLRGVQRGQLQAEPVHAAAGMM